MRMDALLVGIAVTALVITVGFAIFVPGFVAEPDTDEPPARIDVAESTLSTSDVTAETATFEVTTFVRHHGGSAENVSLVVRATDEQSGLLADSTDHQIGSIEGGGERDIPVSVTVPREGSYEIQTILYVDGERIDTARTTVSGVNALTPPHAESAITFHEFHERPSVEYAIESVEDDRVGLTVWNYLSNTGDEPESGLRLEVTARQADSNVIAARAETTIGTIEAGRTTPTDVAITVPDGYNYYLDATLWRDGVIIDSTRAAANLDPQETLDVDEAREPIQFEAGDFETEREQDRPPEMDRIAELEEQFGFGITAALAGILLALLATRRLSS